METGKDNRDPLILIKRICTHLVKSPVDLHDSPVHAFEAAREQAGEADKIAVFGSFLTVADVMQLLSARASP